MSRWRRSRCTSRRERVSKAGALTFSTRSCAGASAVSTPCTFYVTGLITNSLFILGHGCISPCVCLYGVVDTCRSDAQQPASSWLQKLLYDVQSMVEDLDLEYSLAYSGLFSAYLMMNEDNAPCYCSA